MSVIDLSAAYQRRIYPFVKMHPVALDVEVVTVSRKESKIRLKVINSAMQRNLTAWSEYVYSGASVSAMFGSLASFNSASAVKNKTTGAVTKKARKDDEKLKKLIAKAVESAGTRPLEVEENTESKDAAGKTDTKKKRPKLESDWDAVRDYIIRVIPGREDFLQKRLEQAKAEKSKLEAEIEEYELKLSKPAVK